MRLKFAPLALLVAVLLSACGAQGAAPTQAAAASPNPGTLSPNAGNMAAFTPYASATPRPSATPTPPGTATPLPSPSPTPRQHSVARGEDMGGIAFRYGITLEQLMAANPNVNPSAMSIGTVLLIPAGAKPDAGQPTGIPTLTPVPLEVRPVSCATARDGGAWCFLPVRNTTGAALENLSAVVRLADRASGQILSQTALAPLDRLAPGDELPLVAYFPAPVPADFSAGAELLTAMPVAGEGRYLDAQVAETAVEIADGGLSAQASGVLRLSDSGMDARQAWVAAVAYDAGGNIVGARRWEADAPLPPGGQAAFTVSVYSTGAPIARVALLAQARP